MPTFIVEIRDGDDRWLLEWSTVVDAPVTFGMSEDAFRAYYREEYGRHGYENEFEQRMARVRASGTSHRGGESPLDLMRFNRAGHHETQATPTEIVEWYCRRQEEPPEGVGHRHEYDKATDAEVPCAICAAAFEAKP